MQRRRLAALTALVAVVLLSLPTIAWAASRTLVSPRDGVITTRQDIEVEVSKEPLEEVRGLQARLRDAGGGDPGPWVDLTCTARCDDRDSMRFAIEFDPRTGEPFHTRTPPNGRMDLDLRALRPRLSGGNQDLPHLELILSVPGSAVGGLTAQSTAGEVRLRWTRAPEPDISGYRVERVDSGGITTKVADLPPGAEGTRDAPTTAGTYTYRVVTLRPSGRTGTLETVTSIEVRVDPVDDRDGATAPGGVSDDGSGDGGGDTSDGGSAGRSGEGTPSDAGADDRGPTVDRAQRERRDVSAPTVRFGNRSIPRLGELSEGFRGSLDYGTDLPEGATGDPASDEVLLSGPGRGGGGGLLEQLTDPDRVAVPVAGGLLLTAVGLHLWRWLRFPMA